MNDELKSKSEPQFKVKLDTPASFSDIMKLYRRTDGMCVLLFGASLPVLGKDGRTVIPEAYEQARVYLTEQHARQITEVLCRNLDYYPAKEVPLKKDKALEKTAKS